LKKERDMWKDQFKKEKEKQEKEKAQCEGKGKSKGKGTDNQIFVASLPFYLTEEQIKTDFEMCGKIRHMYVPKSEDGSLKGIAFITYEDRASVETALQYDGDSTYGRPIHVKESQGFMKGMKGKGKGDKCKGEKGKGEKGKGEKGEKDTQGDEKEETKGTEKGSSSTMTEEEINEFRAWKRTKLTIG